MINVILSDLHSIPHNFTLSIFRFFPRIIYDLLFFFVVIIIVLNLIFGVIIDTFADLRSEKQEKDEILRNTCFICRYDSSIIKTLK